MTTPIPLQQEENWVKVCQRNESHYFWERVSNRVTWELPPDVQVSETVWSLDTGNTSVQDSGAPPSLAWLGGSADEVSPASAWLDGFSSNPTSQCRVSLPDDVHPELEAEDMSGQQDAATVVDGGVQGAAVDAKLKRLQELEAEAAQLRRGIEEDLPSPLIGDEDCLALPVRDPPPPGVAVAPCGAPPPSAHIPTSLLSEGAPAPPLGIREPMAPMVWQKEANPPIWSQRVLQLAKLCRTGLHLCSVAWEWEERWTHDRIDDYKPCRKMKDAVTKYVQGAMVVNDLIFACEVAQADDQLYRQPALLEKAQARVKQVQEMGSDERNRIRERFESKNWQSWSTSYQVFRVESALCSFYRCVLEVSFPPGPGRTASSASSPLAGTWTYTVDGKPYDLNILEEGSKLIYSEALSVDQEYSGELVHAEGNEGWWEGQLTCNGRTACRVRVRWAGEATIMTQTRIPGSPDWDPALNAHPSNRSTYVGYGEGPLQSATSAMEDALKDPRAPPVPTLSKRAVGGLGFPCSPSMNGVGVDGIQSSMASSKFNEAKIQLDALMNTMTALRFEEVSQEEANPCQPAHAQLGLAPTNEEENRLDSARQKLEALETAVMDLLDGPDAVPLTDPGWVATKVLSLLWQYFLAFRDLRGLRQLGAALRAAHARLVADAMEISDSETPCGSDAEVPQGSRSGASVGVTLPVGMPFHLWEDLIERSTRAAHMENEGIAEAALSELGPEMPPPQHHYSAHFFLLLHYERISEMREKMSNARTALTEGCTNGGSNETYSWLPARSRTPAFEAVFKRKPQHRPDFELRLMADQPRPTWGPLRKGELMLVTPFSDREIGEAVPAELQADFDLRDEESAITPVLKLKLWAITVPEGPSLKVLRAGRVGVEPIRSSNITHDRQAEALRSIAKPGGGIFHPSVRGLILRSWDTNCVAASLGLSPPSVLSAECPEGLDALPSAVADNDSLEGCSVPLTPAQSVAVQGAATRRCTLVRGPPGTGKTHTACAIIERWLSGICRRVLVVTQSNVAASNIQQRLAEFGLPAVRVGLQLKPEELLNQKYFVSLFEPWELQPLHDICYGGRADPLPLSANALSSMMQRAVKKAPVVVMTCISSGNMGLLGQCKFQRVLLDEAAQATEPTSLVPLMTGAGAFVGVGDDKQLPATVKSREAKAKNLDESLFERLLRQAVVAEGNGFVQLDIQRRMHSSIAQFPSKCFYGGRVGNGCNDEDRPAISGMKWPQRGRYRVVFVDMDGGSRHAEEQEGTSLRNTAEAKLIVEVLLQLLDSPCDDAVSASEIAIIAGYSAQRDLIKRSLQQQRVWHPLRRVRVDTVDGFQGMERDLVLVSTTRSNNSGEVGFLRDARRTNVLLTRARRGLIVFGSAATLSNEEEVWGPWLQWIKHTGGMFSRQYFQTLLE